MLVICQFLFNSCLETIFEPTRAIRPPSNILFSKSNLCKMVSKQKKWFKSAFNDPKVLKAETPKKKEPIQNVLRDLNDLDSIDLTAFDESFTENNNETVKSAPVPIIFNDFKSSNWIENFAPRSKSELAVHPKKIIELENWFNWIKETKDKTSPPILIITGPSGCAKTTTMQVIAKEFGFTINEWVTPVDIEHFRHDRNDNDNIGFNESQVDKFARFLFQSSRYRSVLDTSTKNLVLVEDFPNAFVKDPSSFEEVLQRYSQYGKFPLIFVVADTKSKTNNIGYSVFTDEFRERFKITTIAFNAVADTMLKNGLKRIQGIMTQPGFQKYYTEPNKDIINSIVLSSQGDIRSAVINLHFASQKNASKIQTEAMNQSTVASKAKKSKATIKSKLKSMGTDDTISLLHTLGRVMNPKYQDAVDEKGNKLFVHSPNEIANFLTSQPSTSLGLIHHNYLSHFQRLDDILGAIESLSCSDVIMNEWRSDFSAEIATNLTVRGVMVYNEMPVTGRWMPIRSGKNLLKSTVDPDAERKKYGISMLVSPNVLACDYRSYAKHIPLNSIPVNTIDEKI